MKGNKAEWDVKRLLNDGHRVSALNRFMEETGRLIYAKPAFKLCCSDMKCCRIPLRCLQEKLGGQTTSTEQREMPKYTVRAGFLLSWLVSNLYRLMERNGHVFVLRLHKFLLVRQMKAQKKICCSPCSFLSVPIKEIKGNWGYSDAELAA